MRPWGKTTPNDRFWAKVDKTAPGGCWEWNGAHDGKGYGQVRINYKLTPAHRVSYEMAHGPIPDGLFLDHVCHNRGCINPDHMRLATNAENTRNALKRSDNPSGFKGVLLPRRGKRWIAQIKLNGTTKRLGLFDTPQLAHQAYCEAALLYHGTFANSGDPKIPINPDIFPAPKVRA